MDNKKKNLAILLMGKKKKEEETEESDLEVIAEEIIDAIKADSASELAESLESFVKVCSDY